MLTFQAEDADQSPSRVVLIGCGSYDHLEPLPAVSRNLKGLHELLADAGSQGRRHCKWILDPDREQFADAVNAAAREASDLLLVYYAGHGLRSDSDGTLYLATKGTSQDRLYAGLEYEYLRQAFLRSRARRKVIILDCCFSGRAISADMGAADDQLAEHALIEGTYLLTASASTSPALAPPGAEYTAFTGEMVAVLRDGIPGAGPDLACQAVYKEIRRQCRSKSLPQPQQRNTDQGGLISLARNRAYQARPGARPRSVALEQLDFSIDASCARDLPAGSSDLDLHLTVSTRSPGGATALARPGRRGLVLLVGCGPSMRQPPAKLAAARAAVARVIGWLPDGVRFAVVAGTGQAAMVYPAHHGLAVASPATRAAAAGAVESMDTGDGVAFGPWLRAAGDLLSDADLGHAILLTDSRDTGETPADLAGVLSAVQGRFSCDCRGLGTDWEIAELRRIATALAGTLDIIPDPAGLADDLMAMATAWMGKTVANPVLRLWTPDGQIRALQQVSPTVEDLSATVITSGPDTHDYPLGVWGVESRDYRLAVSLPSRRPGIMAVAVQAGILHAGPAGDDELVTQTVICARWTADEALRVRLSQKASRDYADRTVPCPACGTPADAEDLFCEACGSDLGRYGFGPAEHVQLVNVPTPPGGR